jgi:hypothetical protein
MGRKRLYTDAERCDRQKLAARRWRSRNPDTVNAQKRRFYAAHKAEIIRRETDRYLMFRTSALLAYGWKCACCGEDRYEFLSIDHVNGGGTRARKTQGGGSRLYRWLADHNYPEGFQVLCHNCNMSKGCYGYCPHWG